MPTIAVSTISFGPDCTALQGIEFAIRHGFRGLELGSRSLWPDVMSDTEVREVRAQAAANGIDLSIHFIHRGVAPASHDPERRHAHLTDLGRTLDLAHDIGARPIVVHPGPIDSPGVEPATASENVRRQAMGNLSDFLSKGARMAEQRGAVLCVENLLQVPGDVLQSYDELVEVVETVDSPAVRITLDFGHADRSDGVSPAVDAFSPYLRHVHMHDSDGARDHLEVGKGSVDLSEYRDFLESFPFTLAIESSDESDAEGCVLRSRDRLRELLGPAAR